MPSPGFRRSLPALDLSPAESTQVRIDPEQELAASQIALEAAKAGAFGGPVAGNIGRSMVSYKDWLRGIESDPLVFRGMKSGPVENPVAINPDPARRWRKAAYGSPSLTEASTYVGDHGVIYPIRLHPTSVVGYEEALEDPFYLSDRATRVQQENRIPDWNRAAAAQPPGEVLVAHLEELSRGPQPSIAGARYEGGAPHYAWTEGTRATPLSPISKSDAVEYLEAAAERVGRPFYDPRIYEEVLGKMGPEWAKEEAYDEDAHRAAVDEIPNDPRFKPTRGARAAQFLKGMVKEALRPKNIAIDALIGSGVGAASALAGYEAGQPRSAGVFNLPGEYRQALSQEDLLAQIEAKNVRKEALRQQYIDEVNSLHGPGTLQPGARIEEISNYLGPVRGLQGR